MISTNRLCRAGQLLLLMFIAPVAVADEPAGLTTEQFAPIKYAISELIRSEMKAYDVPGLSVALVEDQKIVWAEGFGFADRERREPARANTLYSVGGLSMLFTAAAVLQLADQGAIDLDQPVKKYLPEFSMRSRFPQAPAITPRHLLAHLSGLPSMHFMNMVTPSPEPLAAFVARLKQLYVASPPGQVYSPSFPGYNVLGRLIETQCNKSYAVCMQERLLTPLGMPNSTFDMVRVDRRRFATHYWSDEPVSSVTVRDVPGAGLASSVSELSRFMQMLFANGMLGGKPVLAKHSVEEMWRVQNAGVALDLDARVGLGWHLSGVRFPQARTVAWLGNHSPFSRGRMVLLPEHKLGVIVLTNSSNSTEPVEKISERLLELILQNRTLIAPAETQHAVTTVHSPPKPEDIVGHYASALGLITVEYDDDRYRAQMLGKTFKLTLQPEGLYAAEYRFLGLIPIPISVLDEVRLTTTRISTQRIAVAYHNNQAHRLGTRIEPTPLPPAWRQRLGEYQVVERDTLLDLMKLGNVNLAYSDGLLHFRYRVPGWIGLVVKVPVLPVNDTELVVAGTGWLMGETLQVVQQDGRETLHYSGYQYRRVGTK